MKLNIKQSKGKRGFTIVELLTVMSVIIILMGLILPALNMVRRHAMRVQQKNQFHSIGVAMDLFFAEWEVYPDSEEVDEAGDSYCGSMKLAEAMIGQDLMGFHPDSHFRQDGTIDGDPANDLYPIAPDPITPEYRENLKERSGPYLQIENAKANLMKDLYDPTVITSKSNFNEESLVMCDVYKRVKHRTTGKSVGLPILYYRADTSLVGHNLDDEDDTDNIYNYKDNDELVLLGLPSNPLIEHPMSSNITGTTSTGGNPDPKIFYQNTWNKQITTTSRPYKADSYILLSAGFDGEYGTKDDVFNFGN